MEAFNPYVIGPINWNGRKLNAVIISGLTRENIEDGPLAGVAASRVLAENPDLSEPPAKWAVFAKPDAMRHEWRFLGAGSGKHALPEDEAPGGDIPADVIRQLEEICRT